ncbi:MAG: metallophosphoesterase family protein [Thermomicrobiales bacterium]
MIRIAAIGDLHIRGDVPEGLVRHFATMHQHADLLVVAGDITNHGTVRQAELAADLFRMAALPIFAVLGNHDRRTTRRRSFCQALANGGATVLDGGTATIEVRGTSLGIAGVGGSGGGFWPMEGPDTISVKASQALAVRARREATRLDAALRRVHGDRIVVVTHFAPTTTTLGREPVAKYFLLGNCELAKVIDRYDVDLVLHGHAHLGSPSGSTPGGTLVLNVAYDVNGGPVLHQLSSAAMSPPPLFATRVIEGPV